MAADGRSGLRALVSAGLLLLVTLLGAECASAQVAAQGLRPATAPVSYTTVPAEHSGTAEDDSKPRHGARRSSGFTASTGRPGRVCDCDARMHSAHCHTTSVTVRDGTRRGRFVALPLLHQTFRC